MNEKEIIDILKDLTPEQRENLVSLLGGQSNDGNDKPKGKRKQNRRKKNRSGSENESKPRRGRKSLDTFSKQGKVPCVQEPISRAKKDNKFFTSQYESDRKGFASDREIDRKLSGGNSMTTRRKKVKKVYAECSRCDKGYKVYPNSIIIGADGEQIFVCDKCAVG